MIMSIKEVENYIELEEYEDVIIETKLNAIESMIRQFTNNNFQSRAYRAKGNVKEGIIEANSKCFRAGDTIEISRSLFNDGLYVISEVKDGEIIVDGTLFDEKHIQVTKIVYPEDIKLGAVNLLKWDLENRDKVGIKSETISRHSITYYDMDANNLNGYPASLLGFMNPYRKARI